jgi:hypothetical protein
LGGGGGHRNQALAFATIPLLIVEWVDFYEIWYMKPPGNFNGQL